MNYGEIKKYDIADGPGVRVTLFVSGCRHHCKGCFNAETWDFHYGNPYTEKTEKEIYVKEMMLEGIISIQSGESSIVVEERLATYLSNNEKLEIMKSNKNTERAMSNGA